VPALALLRGTDHVQKAEPVKSIDAMGGLELLLPKSAGHSHLEWPFWSLLICTMFAALPLLWIRWTTPDGTLMGGAIEGVALFAFPFLIPLPFFFIGCVGALAFTSKAKNPVSVGTLADIRGELRASAR
jgi:hypothetical protein